jgi:hypothetical protein
MLPLSLTLFMVVATAYPVRAAAQRQFGPGTIADFFASPLGRPSLFAWRIGTSVSGPWCGRC